MWKRQDVNIEVADSGAVATYANTCRVTATRREVFLDFAVSVQRESGETSRIAVDRRVVTNFYTAKRMLQAVALTVQRHEKTFGEPEEDDGDFVELDDSRVVPSYANFCRVTGTPEEMILDFGLNHQPFGSPTKPVPVQWRIIADFIMGKRLMLALQSAIQHHERRQGELEADVRRRMKP